ncbi:MAG: aminotransferase class V-fold PLP-dependent enzyme [Bacteroidota bacterium]
MNDKQHFETQAIRTQAERSQHREHSVPMYLTSSFVFPSAEVMRDTFAGTEDGIIYSRYSNPNTSEFIHKVCKMEGVEAGFATASGMSAVFASMAAFLETGDHIIASRAVFGSTHQLLTKILSKWGITHTYVDPTQVGTWENAVQDNTKMLVLESPSNPGLTLVDLEAAGQFAKKHQLIFNIDNCFASPYLQQPAKYGADLIVHSGTKWMDGQGRVLAGIIVGKTELIDQVQAFCRHTGPALSPFNAWVLSKSLETLAVRMDRHCENALALANFLQDHPQIEEVRYPFLESHPQFELAKRQMKHGGGLVSIVVKGGAQKAMQALNKIELCSLSSNLGDSRTIVTHPSSTTHSKLSEEERLAVGIQPGMIRISVGLEQIEDLKADFQQALLT